MDKKKLLLLGGSAQQVIAIETAKKLGFASITWIKTGCVITCHGGPGALGMVGTNEKA